MKQILGFFVFMTMMAPVEAKKSSPRKNDQVDSELYIVIKNHRASGVHAQAKKSKSERENHVQKKLHHVKKAREEYYKKHAPRGVKKDKKLKLGRAGS